MTITVKPSNDALGTVALDPSSGLRVGDMVMATLTDPDVAPGTVLTWQWKRDADIIGVTSNSYTAVEEDVDKTLSVTVTYMDTRGDGTDTAEGDVGTVLPGSYRRHSNF